MFFLFSFLNSPFLFTASHLRPTSLFPSLFFSLFSTLSISFPAFSFSFSPSDSTQAYSLSLSRASTHNLFHTGDLLSGAPKCYLLTGNVFSFLIGIHGFLSTFIFLSLYFSFQCWDVCACSAFLWCTHSLSLTGGILGSPAFRISFTFHSTPEHSLRDFNSFVLYFSSLFFSLFRSSYIFHTFRNFLEALIRSFTNHLTSLHRVLSSANFR